MISSVPTAPAKTLWGEYDPFPTKASSLNPEEFFEVSGKKAAIRPHFVKTIGTSDDRDDQAVLMSRLYSWIRQSIQNPILQCNQ